MKLKLKDIALLSLLAALMCVGDFAMEWLPNVHFVGVIIVITTAVYRKWALLPIYVYVFIQGLLGGFSPWWMAYIYIWAILWGAVMLIPQKLPQNIRYILYVAVCALHGFMFGILYAPAQALLFGLDFKGTLAWIAAGFYFDMLHGIGNLVLGSLLIYPMTKIIKQTDKYVK